MLQRRSGHSALRRGRVSLANQIYSITATTVARRPFFTSFPAAAAASACFGDRIVLGDAKLMAWVLMPDHVHWLLQLGPHNSIGTVVNHLKSSSARAANRALGRSGPVWAPAYYDHALRKEEDMRTTARYIIANPLRAGLVRSVKDYPFWNAMWL